MARRRTNKIEGDIFLPKKNEDTKIAKASKSAQGKENIHEN
jgi:hypothetical protein